MFIDGVGRGWEGGGGLGGVGRRAEVEEEGPPPTIQSRTPRAVADQSRHYKHLQITSIIFVIHLYSVCVL